MRRRWSPGSAATTAGYQIATRGNAAWEILNAARHIYRRISRSPLGHHRRPHQPADPAKRGAGAGGELGVPRPSSRLAATCDLPVLPVPEVPSLLSGTFAAFALAGVYGGALLGRPSSLGR
jgi:hypothetical protein